MKVGCAVTYVSPTGQTTGLISKSSNKLNLMTVLNRNKKQSRQRKMQRVKIRTSEDWTGYTKMEAEHRYTRNGKNVQTLGETPDWLECNFFLFPFPPFHMFCYSLDVSR